MVERTYEVYLTAVESTDEEPTVESPVVSGSLEFYDSGVWVDRRDSRDFFPYERIRRIRERSGEEPGATEGEEAESISGPELT